MDSNYEDCYSEVDDSFEEHYKLLKDGHYNVKLNNDAFRCPFCLNKKKRFYNYKELLPHASDVAKSMSKNAEQQGKHLALAKYLKEDFAGEGDTEVVPQRLPTPSSSSNQSQEAVVGDNDIYVWPWMGIVIHPLGRNDDKNVLLGSAYWLNKLAIFNPVEVKPLWIEKELAIAVVVKFNNSWSGFKNVNDLEKEYEINHCGKNDWIEKRGSDWRAKTYGWCAREDDFNSHRVIAEYLSSVGELRSFCDIINKQKSKIMVDELLNQIAMKNEVLINVQCKYNLKMMALQNALRQNEELARQKLDNFSRLVEKHKREKEETLNKIHQLEKELESKQKLQMQIQELKGKMQGMKLVEDEDIKKQMKEMNEELEDANSARKIQEVREVQEAYEELITGLSGLLSDTTDIRIKRMGELDEKPFMKACKERFNGEKAEVQYSILHSKWKENIKDSSWYPFKRIGAGNNMKEVVDEEDEQLKNLKEEWGEEVKDAVKTALEELNEFNPSGRCSVPTLWNAKEGRKATLREVIEYMTQQIKMLERKGY